jgi:GT2 family glycosyltransferase
MKESFEKLEELARVPMKTEREMRMVEIMVLKYKAPEVEAVCLQRIIENTDWPYRIVAYDNRQNTANMQKIWNKLIRESPCDYILNMDSDVFVPKLTPCWLTRMMSTFDEFPECQVVITDSNESGGPDRSRNPVDCPPESYHGVFAGFCVLFRKSVVETAGWFDEEFYFYGGDSEWAARFLNRPGSVYLRRDVYVEHLQNYSINKEKKEGTRFDVPAERQLAVALYLQKTGQAQGQGLPDSDAVRAVQSLARLPMKTEREMRMVEIIVLKYKAPEVEVDCARHVVENTDWPFKLVVYDNRQNTANMSKIWNKLIRDSTCDYVLFLNSDAFVPAGKPCWLTRMMSTFESFPDCQVVLPVSDRAGGDFQQRTGAAERPPEECRSQFSGFCFLFKKSVINEVGWFNEDFYFYGADGEWSARFLRNESGKVWVRPDVFVRHLGAYSLKKAEQNNEFDVPAERERAQELQRQAIGFSLPTSIKLNLTCGRGYRPGWINCDAKPTVAADLYFDFRTEVPFPDGSADEIYINGALAQISANEDFVRTMNECWRVLRPGGRLIVDTPCARYPIAFCDPFDVRRFTEETWAYMTEGAPQYKESGLTYGFEAWQQESVGTSDTGIMTAVLRKPVPAAARAPSVVSNALKRLKVAMVGNVYPAYELVCPHWNGIQDGLTEVGVPFRYLSTRTERGFNHSLCEEIEGYDPDLIVYGLLDVLEQPDMTQRIREKFPRATIAFWYCDLRNSETGQYAFDCRDTIDVMFVSNDAQREFYRDKLNVDRIHFLAQGCTPIKTPLIIDHHSSDFVFIGGKSYSGPFERRARIIDHLERHAGLKRINGAGSEEREQIYRDMPAIYSSSKVTLDMSHFWDIPKYTSIRYWEVPAYWGFSLTRRFPGCEEFYEDKVHRVYFDSIEECIDLKDYYLRHEAEREKIRRAGWEHSHRHTYKERFQEMFRILGL